MSPIALSPPASEGTAEGTAESSISSMVHLERAARLPEETRHLWFGHHRFARPPVTGLLVKASDPDEMKEDTLLYHAFGMLPKP